jgi:uncharacterized protein YndB with AHSA1/START domain
MNPTSASDSIVWEIAIRASAERIFEALTNPESGRAPEMVVAQRGEISDHARGALGSGRDRWRHHRSSDALGIHE